MHKDIYHLEPLWPTDKTRTLELLAIDILRSVSALSASVHPITAQTIVSFVTKMNCYYSNLIEGHNTHPLDIERALNNDYSQEPKKRALQFEAKAHIATQISMEKKLQDDPDIDICSKEFLCWIHAELYQHMPEEFLIVSDNSGKVIRRIKPGFFRNDEVQVGRHIAPLATELDSFIKRFHEAYALKNSNDIQAIVAISASHHRLTWIHPFLDGNGRVARLFSYAFSIKRRLTAHGLWTISRGLARSRQQYFEELAAADQKRINNYDGRGYLSDKGLQSFCEFFLNVALDQINFMKDSLALTAAEQRLTKYAKHQIALGNLMSGAEIVLPQLFAFGEIARGEIKNQLNRPDRTTQRLIKQLLEKGLVLSNTPKGALRFGLPISLVPYLFPHLMPDSLELDLL